MLSALKDSSMTALVWFKSTDMRLRDNQVLHAAHSECNKVMHCYIIDPATFRCQSVSSSSTAKYSMKRLAFLAESLVDLNSNLEKLNSCLYVFTGSSKVVIEKAMTTWLENPKLYFHEETVHEEKQLVSTATSSLASSSISTFWGGGTLYEDSDLTFPLEELGMFTSFRKLMEPLPIAAPLDLPKDIKISPSINAETFRDEELIDLLDRASMTCEGIMQRLVEISSSSACRATDDPYFSCSLPKSVYTGGETSAWERIAHYIIQGEGRLSCYKETRNGLVGKDYSSKLSMYLATGAITARQVVAAVQAFELSSGIKNESTGWIIFELLWRDYMKFYGMKYGRKLFYLGGAQGKDGIRKHPWGNDLNLLSLWMTGRTGYPFVDANMRELMQTGYMSNRGRQVVASFLVRDMGQDWRRGAEFFESHLLDHDVNSNYGNWQYSAGVGADPRDDRYFNIIKQAILYDPNAEFIRLWCPELSSLPTECLLNPLLMTAVLRVTEGIDTALYPPPCVDLLHKDFKAQNKSQMSEKAKKKLQAHGNIPGI